MEDKTKPKTISESLGSSPGKVKDPLLDIEQEDKTTPTGKKFLLKSETPDLPPHGEPAFQQFATTDLSAGNHKYVIDLKERGLLGLFRSRDKTQPTPIRITIDPIGFHKAIASTLFAYLENALRKKSTLNEPDAIERAKLMALVLADGCALMAYLKVRSITVSEFQDDYEENNLKRPRVTGDHVIPIPFAFAIQQLGIVHVSDLDQEFKYAPVFINEGHCFGIPTERIWNPNDYYEAVAYAKTLGMQFGIVDLKEKKGTAWWLFNPYVKENVFELICTIPEVNFTSALALTYALFLPKDPNAGATLLFDISDLLTNNYGSMMRLPHNGINLTAFESIAETEQEVWTHV